MLVGGAGWWGGSCWGGGSLSGDHAPQHRGPVAAGLTGTSEGPNAPPWLRSLAEVRCIVGYLADTIHIWCAHDKGVEHARGGERPLVAGDVSGDSRSTTVRC